MFLAATHGFFSHHQGNMDIPLFGLVALLASLPFHDACLRRRSPATCNSWRRALTALVLAIGVHGALRAASTDALFAHVLVVLLAGSLVLVGPRIRARSADGA